jgi:hypothetical protein
MEMKPWVREKPFNIDVDEDKIGKLLLERDAARKVKDYDTADDLMDTLNSMGVAFADDRNKVWFSGDPNEKGSMRATDWDCPECGALVYGSKVECYRCGCPKGEDTGPPQRFKAADGQGGPQDMRPPRGDYGPRDDYGYDERRAPREDRRPPRGDFERPPRGDGGKHADVYTDRYPPFVRVGDMEAVVDDADVEELLAEREQARRFKDFTLADDIR